MSALATTYKFTFDEFYRLYETGFIDSKDRIELLNGELIIMHALIPSDGTASPLAFPDVAIALADIIPPG